MAKKSDEQLAITVRRAAEALTMTERVLERDEIVTWSALGRRHLNRTPQVGVFKGMTRSMFAKVLWDGYRTVMTLHPDFIERVTFPDGEQSPKCEDHPTGRLVDGRRICEACGRY